VTLSRSGVRYYVGNFTVMLVNLDSQPVVSQSLWVRWFVDY